MNDLKTCLYSLNFDESTYMVNTSQLEVRGRTVISVMTKEEIHTIILLKERMRGKDVFMPSKSLLLISTTAPKTCVSNN
jgi:hypothetical protein